jgi:GNAT superfamily N-acetyltransferase
MTVCEEVIGSAMAHGLDPAPARPGTGYVTLPDDTQLFVRPIDRGDVCRLRRMFDRLSPRSIYFRFFAPIHAPRAGMLEHLADVDHERREALVALVDDEIIGVARYEGGEAGADAELAVTVEDAWQHRGLGALLSRRLARLACDRGFDAFTATVLGENRAALNLLRKVSPVAEVRFASGQYGVYAPLRSETIDRSRVR